MIRLSLVFFLLLPACLLGQDAKAIVAKAEQTFRGKSNKSEMTMTIVRPGWSREISMRSWSLGDDYSLILILSPARDKGSAFLKRGNEVWNWQPSIQRTIKLPPSMMSQSWMGSDFTNDDLVRDVSVVDDYQHTLLGSATIDGRNCYKIEMIPHPDVPVVWGKVIQWIDKANYWTLQVEQYDEDGYLVNTMHTRDIRNLGGRQLPATMEMIPADSPDQKTVITYQSIEFNIDIETTFFSIQNMKRLRP